MIQIRSRLRVADNSGAKEVECIYHGKGYKKRFACVGDIINVVVKEAIPHGIVKKSEVCPAVLVRQRKEYRRKDGSYIRFDDNAVVIIDKKTKEPKGTRVFGPIAREIKNLGFNKIASLAEEVL